MSDFLLESSSYYYYYLLDRTEKELYKIFVKAVLNMQEKVTLNIKVTPEQVDKVAQYVANDRPDLFWYEGGWRTTSRDNVVITVTFPYIYTKLEAENFIAQMEASSFYKMVNARLRAERTDFHKALALYELIIKNTEYHTVASKSSKEDRNGKYAYVDEIRGVILNHRAVCSGYSKTFQYFASKHGIYCTSVAGKTGKDGRHAWNLVRLNGNYYYIDVTWGDPTFSGVANKDPNYISYDYFCNTTQEILQSHKPQFDDKVPLCTATECNYYEYFGMKEAVYSTRGFAMQILKAVKRKSREVYVKYTSQSQYQIAKDRLFNKREIYEAMRLAGISEMRAVKYKAKDKTQTIKVTL